jgi:putative ribosome biogenesis GTPase RsgA
MIDMHYMDLEFIVDTPTVEELEVEGLKVNKLHNTYKDI